MAPSGKRPCYLQYSIASIWQSIVGRRRLNSHSGRARGGIVPRLHREITPGERAVTENATAATAATSTARLSFVWLLSPLAPLAPLPPARRYPMAVLIGPRVNALDPAAWVASGSLLGCQPDCRVRAGEAESEQSGHSRAHTHATALHPPPTISFAAETLAVWSISTEHGAWSMEHGPWTMDLRSPPWPGAPVPFGAHAVRCVCAIRVALQQLSAIVSRTLRPEYCTVCS
jgi:hypothetical protein